MNKKIKLKTSAFALTVSLLRQVRTVPIHVSVEVETASPLMARAAFRAVRSIRCQIMVNVNAPTASALTEQDVNAQAATLSPSTDRAADLAALTRYLILTATANVTQTRIKVRTSASSAIQRRIKC